MLNIPDEVKALFKRDDIAKNFHVHFPNGENADLNNDDVVTESVSFTESLCSQQSFRFGLTEASELKFTCVNVPNIRGATLEAAIEIDVATLGAAWISSHQPSGTEAFLDPQVCTYDGRDLYRVPYGVFIVDTCPRNHETMYKRDVTAYTERLESNSINQVQTALMNAMYANTETYEPSAKALSYAYIGNLNNSILPGAGYTESAITPVGSYTVSDTRNLYDTDGNRKTVYFTVILNDYTLTEPKTSLFKIDWNGSEYTDENIIDCIVRSLEFWDIDPVRNGYASMEELALSYLNGARKKYFYPHAVIDIPLRGTSVSIPQTVNIFNLYMQTQTSSHVYIPRGIDTSNGDYYTPIVHQEYYNTPVPTVYELADSTAIEDTLVFNSTLQTVSGGLKMYSFANAFSVVDVVQGYLELECRFGSPSRTGGIEVTALDNSSPVSIVPGNYSECWYDETTIAPIGIVKVKFKDADESEQDAVIEVGTGASVYDMTANAVIQNTVFTLTEQEITDGVTIQEKIADYLNARFTPNIPDMSFVPIELTKQGLPYLEAGDAIEVTTGDGQTVPSFILRQTINGIQFLTAEVESANGEAMEMLEE